MPCENRAGGLELALWDWSTSLVRIGSSELVTTRDYLLAMGSIFFSPLQEATTAEGGKQRKSENGEPMPKDQMDWIFGRAVECEAHRTEGSGCEPNPEA